MSDHSPSTDPIDSDPAPASPPLWRRPARLAPVAVLCLALVAGAAVVSKVGSSTTDGAGSKAVAATGPVKPSGTAVRTTPTRQSSSAKPAPRSTAPVKTISATQLPGLNVGLSDLPAWATQVDYEQAGTQIPVGTADPATTGLVQRCSPGLAAIVSGSDATRTLGSHQYDLGQEIVESAVLLIGPAAGAAHTATLRAPRTLACLQQFMVATATPEDGLTASNVHTYALPRYAGEPAAAVMTYRVSLDIGGAGQPIPAILDQTYIETGGVEIVINFWAYRAAPDAGTDDAVITTIADRAAAA